MRSKDPKSTPRLVDANSGILSLNRGGGVNWPRTLRLAQFAYRDQIERAIVTVAPACVQFLQRRMPHLAGLLSQHQIAMEVTPAIELTLRHDLFDQVVHTSTIVGGPLRRYVFLRIPRDCLLPVLPVVEALRRMELTAILLAPERCDRFREDESELRQIVSAGGRIQLSAASLLDQTDRTRIRFCRHLLRKNLCHFVASESGRHHDLPISLGDAYRVVLRWAGSKVADAVCRDHPSRLFDGQSIDVAAKRQRIAKLFSRAA